MKIQLNNVTYTLVLQSSFTEEDALVLWNNDSPAILAMLNMKETESALLPIVDEAADLMASWDETVSTSGSSFLKEILNIKSSSITYLELGMKLTKKSFISDVVTRLKNRFTLTGTDPKCDTGCYLKGFFSNSNLSVFAAACGKNKISAASYEGSSVDFSKVGAFPSVMKWGNQAMQLEPIVENVSQTTHKASTGKVRKLRG